MDSYFKDIARVLLFAAGAATLPLIAAFAGLQPPWPPAVEYISAVFILIAALVMWEWVRGARRVIRRRFILAGLTLTIVGIGAYLPLYSLYVLPIPGSKIRVVKGTECTRRAQLVYPNDCPNLSRDALRDAEWEANVLWTPGSIMRIQMMLVAGWLAFIGGLIAFIGAVIAGRPVTGKKAVTT